MADPSFGEIGTLSVASSINSLSTTIGNVSTGDLLVVIVQRQTQTNCTGVASSSPALTFTKIATAQAGSGFNTDLWAALATTSASSQVITANYSNTDNHGSIFSARYTSGVSSITPTATAAHSSLQSTTTNRTITNISPGVRTLLIAAGTNWDYYNNMTPATNWNERVDNNSPFGSSSTLQFMFDRIADSGTYPSGNFATNANTDRYIALIVAFPVTTDGATGLPRRAVDGPFYGALRGSVR